MLFLENLICRAKFSVGGRGESDSAEGRTCQDEERDYEKEEREGEGSGRGAHRVFAPAGGDRVCIHCKRRPFQD